MGLLNLAKTADQAIYEATCLELVRELSGDLSKDKPTKESFTSINGLDKSVQEINFTKGIHKLFQKYHNQKIPYPSTDDNVATTMKWQNFTNDIEIMKIGSHDMSINQAMEIAGNLYAEVGPAFYGMLLSTKGSKQKRTIFNPLHPILIAELNKEDANFDLDKQEWSIAIYSFKDNHSKHYDALRNKENYIDEIATIVTSINSPANYVIENSDFNVDILDDTFVLNYKEVKRERNSGELISDNDSRDRNYIVPAQIINVRGVAYPNYGVVYSRKGLAWNLTPSYHANINHPHGQSDKNGMEGGSRICTHSGNSKTQMGLSSLNHCNTTSPLNSYLCTEGFATYGEQSLRASLEMFLGDAFKEHGAVAARVLSYQEFLKENNGNGTKKAYLAYLKDRLNSKMDGPTEEVVAESGITYENYSTEKWNRKGYKRGDITTDNGKEPQVFTGDYEKVNCWLDIDDFDAICILNEPKIQDYDNGRRYEVGDIVIDQYMNKNEWNKLRVMTDKGWRDYKNMPKAMPKGPATPVAVQIDAYGTGTNRVNATPVVNMVIPEFIDGTVYDEGVIVQHNGRRYLALTQAIVTPIPNINNGVWRDITPEQNEQVVA